ncbi:hypothetical protein [Cupriavidus sp. 8B]
MPINEVHTDAYADLGDIWLRDQSARLKQKHLQFGRHYRMDFEALLARNAQAARTGRAAAMPAESRGLPTDRIRRATIEAIEYCSQLNDPLARMARLPAATKSSSHPMPATEPRGEMGFATPGEFSLINRFGATPRDEWMAVLSDLTEVVVVDVHGMPSSLGIEKAASIVQNRACLEALARQLLIPLTRDDGDWHLNVIDFGVEAQRHDCEFLMCFSFRAANPDLSVTSPFAEVGFALHKQSLADPIFMLTVRTALGFDATSISALLPGSHASPCN